MKKTNKLLSILLAILMLLSAVPMATFMSFAATTAKPISEYAVGDLITLGSYPQSEVKDCELIAKKLEPAAEDVEWISYGYMSGDGSKTVYTGSYYPGFQESSFTTLGSIKPSDYMKYKDVVVDGEKYRAITFDTYRKIKTFSVSNKSEEDTNQPANGYFVENTYWFKFEPLTWRVLDPAIGLILCESVIDSQPMNDTSYCYKKYQADRPPYVPRTGNGYNVNDYENSTLRTWLNESFYNTAFTEAEKDSFEETELENEMIDKIFLLSYEDAQNAEYGFEMNEYGVCKNLIAYGTDYAKSQGVSGGLFEFLTDEEIEELEEGELEYIIEDIQMMFGEDYESYFGKYMAGWILRSDSGYFGTGFGCTGSCLSDGFNFDETDCGIRPALTLKSENTFAPATNSTETTERIHFGGEATCTEKAVCEGCGEEYGELLDHEPAEAIRENVIEATCQKTGSYEDVISCAGCGIELSRETKTIDKLDHTPSAAVIENEVAATCKAAGSYDEVVYCAVCGDEISRETKTIDKLAHTPSATVIENEVEATCSVAGSYDKVVYCKDCGDEISRETKYTPKAEHRVPFALHSDDGSVAPTCTSAGRTAEVACLDCGEIVVPSEVIPALKHLYKLVSTTEPTDTTKGEKKYKCIYCGDDYSEEIEALGTNSGRSADNNSGSINDGKRCKFCPKYEQNKDVPVIGIFFTIVHFFIHLFTAK